MARLVSAPTSIVIQKPQVGIPNYISALVPGAAVRLSSKLSDAFVSFAGQAGDPIGIYFYSGAVYDTKRGCFVRNGGGHNDFNGNGIFGFSPYSSENPKWSLIKAHTTPPSVTNFTSPSVESAPNGDPASTHTYNQIVYDKQNDKLILFGLGSAAGSTGSSFARIRAFNFTSNSWDALSAHPSKTGTNAGGMACYDEVGKLVWGRDGGLNIPLQRFDVVANTISAVNDGLSTMNIDVSVAMDSGRRYIIAIGGYGGLGPLDNGSADMVLWDVSGSSVVGYSRKLTGFPDALRSEKLALEFHPPSGSFVSWKGGNTIYRLIPPTNPFTGTWSFQTLAPTGDGLPNASLGVYSGFRWAPYPGDSSKGVFIMDCIQGSSGAYTASPVTIYKPNF